MTTDKSINISIVGNKVTLLGPHNYQALTSVLELMEGTDLVLEPSTIQVFNIPEKQEYKKNVPTMPTVNDFPFAESPSLEIKPSQSQIGETVTNHTVLISKGRTFDECVRLYEQSKKDELTANDQAILATTSISTTENY
jgi:hypothetical protein